MERRYEARLEEMLEDAEVPPEMLEGMLTRLETFVEPFAESLDEPAQRRHALEYMTGLLSDLKHKTGGLKERIRCFPAWQSLLRVVCFREFSFVLHGGLRHGFLLDRLPG
jgi:hypothetical protein